ncbi:hypothetical protein [Synechococcus elongatus]|uniref:hypothetical protein n=1 Tax=Synechococcus elongatus TaxID=32046 RepID=UPI0030D09760
MSHPVPSLSPQADRWLAPLAIALYVWQFHNHGPEPLLQAWEAIATAIWQRQEPPAAIGIAALPQRYLTAVPLESPKPTLLPELDLQLAIARQQAHEPEAIALELANLGRQFGTVILPLHWWRSLPQARLQFLCRQLGAWQAGYRQPPMQQGV